MSTSPIYMKLIQKHAAIKEKSRLTEITKSEDKMKRSLDKALKLIERYHDHFEPQALRRMLCFYQNHHFESKLIKPSIKLTETEFDEENLTKEMKKIATVYQKAKFELTKLLGEEEGRDRWLTIEVPYFESQSTILSPRITEELLSLKKQIIELKKQHATIKTTQDSDRTLENEDLNSDENLSKLMEEFEEMHLLYLLTHPFDQIQIMSSQLQNMESTAESENTLVESLI